MVNTYCSRCPWEWRTSDSASGPIVALQAHHAVAHTVVTPPAACRHWNIWASWWGRKCADCGERLAA